MRIVGTGLGKKYNTNWIFRDLQIEIAEGQSLAIVGANGSGKSTLLQILINALTPTNGKVTYTSTGEVIIAEEVTNQVNFSAPYSDLIEEFTLIEHLNFHSKFKKPLLELEEIVNRMGYPQAKDKTIGEFSSGMKQRLKLALCFFFDGSVIALDEPTSNLDTSGIEWYQSLISSENHRTVLIASNQRYEYDFCSSQIEMS